MENITDSICHKTNVTINDSDDFDVWAYVECYRGLQRQPLYMALPITIINCFIFVTGFLGNICVCIVIAKHSSLHTATNYYLFNLAISDLLLLVFGLPNDVASYWHMYPWNLGEFFCKSRALVSEMASYVSVLTIVAFSTERYLAICYPLYLHKMSGFQRAAKIIAVMWVVCFLAALPFAHYTTVDMIYYPNSNRKIQESAFCGMLNGPKYLCEISTFTFFIVPLIIICVLYVRMGLKIHRTARKTLGKELKGSVHRTNRRLQVNKNVIRMLTYVVIGFFFSWAPFHAQRLVYIYMQDHPYYEEINTWIFIITGIFYYFSSTLNPILYNLMSVKMRNAFKEVILRKKPQRTFITTSQTTTVVRDTRSNRQSQKTDDTEQLVKKEMVNTPPSRNKKKIIYKRNKNIKNGDTRISLETSI
ncbi:neuropeptides capa receptor [Aethina tumida]|uniref:neuropeptides capa receptor n=1 Tax=Aethina tumida TaxID=116153 RepID=UPI002148E033|nr:neuropeptides capa receptor [Aethina tumida]